MKTGLYATGILLIAGATVLVVAGAAALDASHQQTANTLDSEPPVIQMGQDLQSWSMAVLPWVGLIGVVTGIVGLLALNAFAKPTTMTGRRR